MLLSLKNSNKVLSVGVLRFANLAQSDKNCNTFEMLTALPIRSASKRAHENFSFPKHNELFTKENLDTEDQYSTDEEDLGIMRKYRRRRNVTTEELMQDDFNQVRRNMDKQLYENYNVEGASESQLMEHTQSIIARLKHNRKPDTSAEFKRRRLQSEYLNFGKYQENYITQGEEYDPDDTGREIFHLKNYRDAMKRMNIENSVRERQRDLEVLEEVSEMNKEDPSNTQWADKYISMQKSLNTYFS
jgi:hypothetical protein